ncbi:MAG: hypothetical protein KGO02_01170 [Alphaproteobacteria bacterium]|nr:hypothetical protein [Alphaproteobacteria bacterium]
MTLRYRLAASLVLAGMLAGCAGPSPYEQLMAAKPTGSPFSRALYHQYARLAESLHISEIPGRTSFDARGSLSLTEVSPDRARLAIHYAQKAESAASGEEPLPEAAPADDRVAENLRLELLRMLSNGRSKAPAKAAQAQADYDCWVLDATVASLSAASQSCHAALLSELNALHQMPGIFEGGPSPSGTHPEKKSPPDAK